MTTEIKESYKGHVRGLAGDYPLEYKDIKPSWAYDYPNIETPDNERIKDILYEAEKIKPGIINYLKENKINIILEEETQPQAICIEYLFSKPPWIKKDDNTYWVTDVDKKIYLTKNKIDNEDLLRIFTHEYAHCKETIETLKKKPIKMKQIKNPLNEPIYEVNEEMENVLEDIYMPKRLQGEDGWEIKKINGDIAIPSGKEIHAEHFVQRLPLKHGTKWSGRIEEVKK